MKVEQKIDTEISFATLPSDELIEYISFKTEYPEEAEKAFVEFCSRFERKIFEKAEIYCSKFDYNEAVAEYIAHCAFARVWKYHSFDKGKAKKQNIEDSIHIWLCAILYNEMVKYHKSHSCAEKNDEDLPIIESFDQLINYYLDNDDEDLIEKKKDLKNRLEEIERSLQGLSIKHRTIYLTYKAYKEEGKYLPRKVSKNLCERLNLTQASIRVYRMEAENHIKNYLSYLNGNK